MKLTDQKMTKKWDFFVMKLDIIKLQVEQKLWYKKWSVFIKVTTATARTKIAAKISIITKTI